MALDHFVRFVYYNESGGISSENTGLGEMPQKGDTVKSCCGSLFGEPMIYKVSHRQFIIDEPNLIEVHCVPCHLL